MKSPTSRELLRKYARRQPKAFIQFDGWHDSHGDDVIPADPQGHSLTGTRTWELMQGASVRVLADPTAPQKEVGILLRKIANWIETDSRWWHGIEVLPPELSSEGLVTIHQVGDSAEPDEAPPDLVVAPHPQSLIASKCALCGNSFSTPGRRRIALVVADTQQPVCLECGDRIEPDLAAMLRLADAAESYVRGPANLPW